MTRPYDPDDDPADMDPCDTETAHQGYGVCPECCEEEND